MHPAWAAATFKRWVSPLLRLPANRLRADPGFVPVDLPVSPDHLRAEGLGPAFVEYMKSWKDFVRDNEGVIDDELILNS